MPEVPESSVFDSPVAEAPTSTFEAPSTPEVPEASIFDASDTPFSEWTTPASTESGVATPSDTTSELPAFELPAQDSFVSTEVEGQVDAPTVDNSTAEVDRPMSIFRTSGADDAPAATSAESESITDDDDDDWVSHHIIEPQRDHGLFDEVPSASAAPAAPTQLEGDALWHVETYPYDLPAPVESVEADSAAIDETAIADTTIDGDQSEDLWDTVTETEEMLSTLDPMVGLTGGSELFEASEGFADEQGFERAGLALVSDHDVISDEEEQAPKYGTDEDLPIPDFTGVYDETPSNWTVPGEDPVASAEGSITQTTAMMRRDELDRLRPAGEVIEDSQATQTTGRSKMVVLIGILLALAGAAFFFREQLLGLIP